MRLSTAILCDAATVREGLLHILGGGITRLWREALPAPLGLTLALVFELERDEVGLHEIGVVMTADDGEQIAEVRGAIQAQVGRLEPGETQLMPMPIPLDPVGVTKYGRHTIAIQVDGVDQDASFAFWVLHPEEQVLPPLD